MNLKEKFKPLQRYQTCSKRPCFLVCVARRVRYLYLVFDLRKLSMGEIQVEIWTFNFWKISSLWSLKFQSKTVQMKVVMSKPKSKASVLQITLHGAGTLQSVMEHETKFAYPTKMTSLTIKIKEKTLCDFTAQQICIMFFQASQSLWLCWKTVKRQAIAGAFSIFLGAKFIFSTDAVYKSDNMEMQTDQGETAFVRLLHFF